MSAGVITSSPPEPPPEWFFNTPTYLERLPPSILELVAQVWKMSYDIIHASPYLSPKFFKANLLERAKHEVRAARNRDLNFKVLDLISIAKVEASFNRVAARETLAETARFVVAHTRLEAAIVKAWVSMDAIETAKTFVLSLEPFEQRELLLNMIALDDTSNLPTLQELLRLACNAPSLVPLHYEHTLALLKVAALQAPKDAYATLKEAMQKATHIRDVSQYVEINVKIAEVAAQHGDLKTAKERLRAAEAQVTTTQRLVSAHAFIPVMRAKASIGLPLDLPDELLPTGRGLIEIARVQINNKHFDAARQTLGQAKTTIFDPPELEDIPPVEGLVTIAKLQRLMGDHAAAKSTLAEAKKSAQPPTCKRLTAIFSVEQYIDLKQAKQTLEEALLLAKSMKAPLRRTRAYIAIAAAIDTNITRAFTATAPEDGPAKKVRRLEKMIHV